LWLLLNAEITEGAEGRRDGVIPGGRPICDASQQGLESPKALDRMRLRYARPSVSESLPPAKHPAPENVCGRRAGALLGVG